MATAIRTFTDCAKLWTNGRKCQFLSDYQRNIAIDECNASQTVKGCILTSRLAVDSTLHCSWSFRRISSNRTVRRSSTKPPRFPYPCSAHWDNRWSFGAFSCCFPTASPECVRIIVSVTICFQCKHYANIKFCHSQHRCLLMRRWQCQKIMATDANPLCTVPFQWKECLGTYTKMLWSCKCPPKSLQSSKMEPGILDYVLDSWRLLKVTVLPYTIWYL